MAAFMISHDRGNVSTVRPPKDTFSAKELREELTPLEVEDMMLNLE